MRAVIYYSNTAHSRKVAEFLAEKLTYPIFDIEKVTDLSFSDVAIVFPVHCQNIPQKVSDFLSKCHVERLCIIATYGKMSHGNVLYEIQNKYQHTIVAAAYVPTKHSYIPDDEPFDDFDALLPVVEKIKAPAQVVIPRSAKNIFANFLIDTRSRIGVKIVRTDACNECGVCTNACRFSGIVNGKTNRQCIRCISCVQNCPQNALEIRLSLPMKLYLKKKKVDKTEIFV
jgi:ferredoxin